MNGGVAEAVEIVLEFLLIPQTLLQIPSLTRTIRVNTVLQSNRCENFTIFRHTAKESPHA